MFGISLTEMVMIALVALVFVGPKKLPRMMRTVGEWVGKARSLTTQVRQQTGIDEILRQEGIDGGLSELRGLLRGDLGSSPRPRPGRADQSFDDPYQEPIEYDRSREYPLEGADAYGALPDDLVFDLDALDAPTESAPLTEGPDSGAASGAQGAREAQSEPAADEASAAEPSVDLAPLTKAPHSKPEAPPQAAEPPEAEPAARRARQGGPT